MPGLQANKAVEFIVVLQVLRLNISGSRPGIPHPHDVSACSESVGAMQKLNRVSAQNLLAFRPVLADYFNAARDDQFVQ